MEIPKGNSMEGGLQKEEPDEMDKLVEALKKRGIGKEELEEMSKDGEKLNKLFDELEEEGVSGEAIETLAEKIADSGAPELMDLLEKELKNAG